MKNLLLLITGLAIVGSSCSSKIGIAKRKYGKGYYVSVSHKPKNNNSKSETFVARLNPEKEQVQQVIVPSQVKNDKNHSGLASSNAIALTQNKKLTVNPSRSEGNLLFASRVSASSTTSKKSIKQLDSVVLSKNSKADDTNTILLVILCLFPFINLIAVYLKQGKSITNDFWITLILDFTLILGIVYSILVVLDVMSFA